MTITPPALPNPLPALPPINDELRSEVFTHSSVISPANPQSYDRLSALGDASLSAAVTRILFDHPDRLDPAQITERRSAYVSSRSTSVWGRVYGLDNLINARVLWNEANRESLVGAVFKAYLGAVVLSSSFDEMTRYIRQLLAPMLSTIEAPNQNGADDADVLQNFHERLVRLKVQLPTYPIETNSTENGHPLFTVKCSINGHVLGKGVGRNIKEGRRAAARAASMYKDQQLKSFA